MRVTFLVLLTTLAACGISEDAYPETIAISQCDYSETCSKGAFDQSFVDMDDCVRVVSGQWEVTAGSAKANNCEYRVENAVECLGAWDRITASCDPDTQLTECNAVWVCP